MLGNKGCFARCVSSVVVTLLFLPVVLAQGQPDKKIEGLLKELTNPDWKAREKATDALKALGRDALSAKASLEKLIAGEDAETRIYAAAVLLHALEPTHRAALDTLKKALLDEDTSGIAGHQMARLAKGNSRVLEILITVAVDKKADQYARTNSLCWLRGLGPDAKAAVPRLIPCLEEKYPIGGHTADVLKAIGEDAKAAIAVLKKKVEADKLWLQVNLDTSSMADALAVIDPGNKIALEYHLRLIRSPVYEVRLRGVGGFWGYKTVPEQVQKELNRLAETDPDGAGRLVKLRMTKSDED